MFGRRAAPLHYPDLTALSRPVSRFRHDLAPLADRLPHRFGPPPKRSRNLAPVVGLTLGLAGWVGYTTLIYRGRVFTDATAVSTAPIDRVWGVLGDLDRWPLWQPEIPEAGWLGRTIWEPGARFRWTIRGLRFTSVVESVVAGRSVSWTSSAWGCQERATWRLAPADRGTRIEAHWEASGPGLYALAPWCQAQLNPTLEGWLAALAVRAATGPAAGEEIR